MHKDRNLESFSAVCLDAHKHMCLVAYRLSCIIDVVWGERNYTGYTRGILGGVAVNAASHKDKLFLLFFFFFFLLERAAVLSLRTCEWKCAFFCFLLVHRDTHIVPQTAANQNSEPGARLCTEEKQHHGGCDNKLEIRRERQWWPS